MGAEAQTRCIHSGRYSVLKVVSRQAQQRWFNSVANSLLISNQYANTVRPCHSIAVDVHSMSLRIGIHFLLRFGEKPAGIALI
jgi:hypothetical protein